ncbi:MAG: outer membrane beta-barrel protein [Rhodoferax sp.]
MKKVMKTVGALGLVVCAAMASPFAVADDSGWYGGANIGQSRATIDDARIISGLQGGGYSTSSIIDDDRDRGYKIFGGYQINKNFALEGGYFDLGKFGFTATTVPAGTLSGNIRIKGLNLDVVGTLPITEKFSAFGRIGANYAEAKDSFKGTGSVSVLNPNPSKRDTNLKVGLGLQYAFTESLALRAEVERYRINDAVGNKGDVDLVSVGLVYRFGAKTQAPVARMAEPAPAPVALLAPAAEPVAVTPPPVPVPPPMPMKVSLSADSLFDFDKASVLPSGKQQLDKFVADLQGVEFDVIVVTGHTDRIGAHAYNLKLSTRRAEAVRAYLMESSGVPASKIVTKGVNGAEPVTTPGDCVGSKASKQLIACLQPDRRVELEVTGTR